MLLHLVKSLAARGWHNSAGVLLECALLFNPRDRGLLREHLSLAARAGRHKTLAADCRRLLAVAPDDAFALETLAVIELARGNSDAACAVIDDAHRQGLLGDLRFARDALIDPERARSEGVYVATLHEVEIETADWAILDGGKVYNTEAHNRALAKGPHVQGRATPSNDAYIFRLPPVSQTIDERCVHLGGDHNFCHWITRNMVKLGLLEGTPYETLPYLINADLRRHQREFLELLNVPEERLIKLERPALVHVRELVVPTNVTNHLKMGIGTEWLRHHLAHCMDAAPPQDLLYVSRSDAKVRRLVNEDEVIAALTPLGFQTILPGALPVREQILRFSRAKVIVGAHGAAFGNLVFAPKTARVIEFTSTFKAHIPDFHVLAKICGFHFSSIVSDDYDFSRSEPYQADIDFRVDVAEVLATLRRDAPELF
jgi:capsular polysaccharide biosynthesis protein